jgi:hypothetical protein
MYWATLWVIFSQARLVTLFKTSSYLKARRDIKKKLI